MADHPAASRVMREAHNRLTVIDDDDVAGEMILNTSHTDVYGNLQLFIKVYGPGDEGVWVRFDEPAVNAMLEMIKDRVTQHG